MPWDTHDVLHKTKKARTAKAKRQWVHVANAELKKTGDDKTAIMAANAVVARRKHAFRR